MTKKLTRIGKILSLDQQVELLKKEVLILNDKFEKGTVGRIVSLQQLGNSYWVLLNYPFQTKQGGWSRRKLFISDDLRLLEEK